MPATQPPNAVNPNTWGRHESRRDRLTRFIRTRGASLLGVLRANALSYTSLLVSVTSLSWTIITNGRMLVTGEIRTIIENEARYVQAGDTAAAVALYEKDASIHDLGCEVIPIRLPQTWSGLSEIQQRYSTLPLFPTLDHFNIHVDEVDLWTGYARATSSTNGMMNYSDGQQIIPTPVSSTGNTWEFKRVHQPGIRLPFTGEWKIHRFAYNTERRG